MASLRLWGKVLVAALCSKTNREFYDRISPIYDQCFVTHKPHANTMAEILLEDCKGRGNKTLVLDLGCGTGLLSNILLSKGFEVLGIDISLESLRLLQQREPGINTIQADATLLPFTDGSFHAVVSLGVWRHLSHPQRVIAEVARILEKNGILIVGYFPPAIGGVIHQSNSPWYQLLARLYQFVIRKRGYVDHTDLSLEPRTVNWAENHFLRVMTVDSGKRWRLIVAQGLRTAPSRRP
ncbi:MAG: class I SAM-dependent methyltransferase [Gammaproteobacteria bacterium]|jgi:ubiquinone/menaquinone biosynthesis C-methylase UbiE|nr:class I SAM-dependent methyltransferase [Gammaproteobacteria bacterium]